MYRRFFAASFAAAAFAFLPAVSASAVECVPTPAVEATEGTPAVAADPIVWWNFKGNAEGVPAADDEGWKAHGNVPNENSQHAYPGENGLGQPYNPGKDNGKGDWFRFTGTGAAAVPAVPGVPGTPAVTCEPPVFIPDPEPETPVVTEPEVPSLPDPKDEEYTGPEMGGGSPVDQEIEPLPHTGGDLQTVGLGLAGILMVAAGVGVFAAVNRSSPTS
jgi:LPXTG-motif cell wall-anchored protein